MHKRKKILSIVTCAVLIMTFSSCSHKIEDDQQNSNSSSVVTTTTKKVTKTKAKKSAKKNQLEYNNFTGKYDVSKKAKGKRPVAIMVNNIDASLPQYGIYKADVLFECPVEGGITRLMAMYDDYTKVPSVCSVRSCRYYYALFASSFDAVYLHWGIDKKVADNMLTKLKIDHVDGNKNTTLFKRDENRLNNYALEHTGYCDGALIPKVLKDSKIRTDIKKDYNKPAFNFLDKYSAISKNKCKNITVNFSDYYSSAFTYDSKAKNYKKNRNGEKHIDASNNKQLVYTNVIVLVSKEIKVINNDNGLLSVNWKGGSGYCFSGGAVKKIKWSKDSEFAKIKLTDEKGNALKINKGKTYIGVTKKGMVSYS